ncbi:Undecaprenyl-phosphate galactose phosphotransferase, WbaP/exopolysaccharide biosynthesis polyprenyl glycosylphosphotransferase [Micromonospora rhizosphaerae]|uniref:Undecaprenyl-phosphate galactose phosphotransferase, WbaP/exopolysaccharide biosynthesis polyprenyl glycosylphosphotransferase n=1 Tax=Micromonospora rhizosphaerae TaxID=568872 RepID=A0A1C6SXZ2_9ACTN|nr:Undecaprenyl-phosphate galactose phosphotransferase, WbaP/exopolysaccharide biosynthesis polyprenyl glycosylphosphotransferase [Micromonospora rhizosphaerae]
MNSVDLAPVIDLTAVRNSSTAPPADPVGPTRSGWQSRYVVTLCLVDLTIGLASAAAALGLRFGPLTADPYHRGYLWITITLPFGWMVALTLNRAYETRHLFVGNDEYARVFRAGLALTATLAIVSFAVDFRLARGYVIIAMPLLIVAGVAVRYLVRRRLHRSWARGERLHRVILVGHGLAVAEMTRRLRRERFHGLGVVGACLPHPRAEPAGRRAAGLLPPILGTFEDVATAVSRAGADTVVVLSCPEIAGAALRRLGWQLERDDVDLIVASNLIDVAGDRTTVRPVDGLPMLHVEHPRLKGGRRFVKSVFDRVSALLLLIVAAPLLLAITLLIRMSPGAGGPAIFRQERVGKNGRPFVIYKFRTMYVDAEDRLAELLDRNETDGGLFKMRDDPRVTRVGRWLRRLSLDEVPQLVNVLKGDMSLVGPRPPLPREVAGYPADMRRRLVVKPGLTGLWQVSGRSDLSWEESIRLDLSYVENWSLTMDLAILLRTLSAVIRSSGAY